MHQRSTAALTCARWFSSVMRTLRACIHFSRKQKHRQITSTDKTKYCQLSPPWHRIWHVPASSCIDSGIISATCSGILVLQTTTTPRLKHFQRPSFLPSGWTWARSGAHIHMNCPCGNHTGRDWHETRPQQTHAEHQRAQVLSFFTYLHMQIPRSPQVHRNHLGICVNLARY